MSDELNIDFGALREKAAEMMEATPEAPAATPEAPVVETAKVEGQAAPVVEEKPTEVPPTPAEQKLADLTDDTLVKVTVDGEEQVMPWKDARAGISRTQKFTKSMQQLAKEREAVESQKATLDQLRAEREGFNRFLSDPKAVAQYLMQQFPQQFNEQPAQAPVENGDEIITRAEAMRLAEQTAAQRAQAVFSQLQQQLATVDSRIAEQTAALEHRQETAKHAVAINATLADVFTNNPVLSAIPNAEDLIRYEVAQMKPTTQEAALEAIRNVAKGMVEEIGKHYTNQKKVQVAQEAKQKLVTKTTEPPGGTAPQITPVTFKKQDGTMDWNAITKAAKEAYNG